MRRRGGLTGARLSDDDFEAHRLSACVTSTGTNSPQREAEGAILSCPGTPQPGRALPDPPVWALVGKLARGLRFPQPVSLTGTPGPHAVMMPRSLSWLNKSGPQGRSRINLRETRERAYWTARLGVTAE
jgi:hypothetical protein